jgi:hypothetical protein
MNIEPDMDISLVMNLPGQFYPWRRESKTSKLGIRSFLHSPGIDPGPYLRIYLTFASSCGKCFYCLRGLTSRCEKCLLFGSEKLDGGQAEIVVVPEADGTLFPMPPQLKPELAILMADIFPTG